MYRMTVQRYTKLYAQMIHISISGENGPGGAAEGRIPNLVLKKGLPARVSRATVLIGVSGQNYGVTRGFLVGSDIYASKNEPWLLVFVALGANLKISMFDPPTVGGTYLYYICKILIII